MPVIHCNAVNLGLITSVKTFSGSKTVSDFIYCCIGDNSNVSDVMYVHCVKIQAMFCHVNEVTYVHSVLNSKARSLPPSGTLSMCTGVVKNSSSFCFKCLI